MAPKTTTVTRIVTIILCRFLPHIWVRVVGAAVGTGPGDKTKTPPYSESISLRWFLLKTAQPLICLTTCELTEYEEYEKLQESVVDYNQTAKVSAKIKTPSVNFGRVI